MAKKGTTRYASNEQEKRIQKVIGGRRTKNSGAGRVKGDVLTKDFFFDGKTSMTPVKSKTLNKAEIEKAREQAFLMRKKFFALVMSFGDGKDYAVLPLEDLAALYEGFVVYEAILRELGTPLTPLDEEITISYEKLQKILKTGR